MQVATIRPAVAADAGACAAIYAPYVRDTAVSFETSPPSAADMAARIAAAHAWLVADVGGEVVGYAYATRHRERAAYRWACDVSVYLAPPAQGRGLGRVLYTELFNALAARGFVTALAGVALPNDASVGLHRAMGFEDVGVYRNIGFKAGSWHDVLWLQRALGPLPSAPDDPAPVSRAEG